MIRAAWPLAIAAVLAAAGCGTGSRAGARADAGRRARARDAGAPRDAGRDAGLQIERAAITEPAAERDAQSEGTEAVGVRRLVYELVLGGAARTDAAEPGLAPATAELRVDVSASRLRARFVGLGAPVEAGSEVRLEAGAEGGYLFDGAGGRPLGRGALAAWLDGRARGPARARVTVELDPPAPRGAEIDAGVPIDAGEPGVAPDAPPSTTRPSGSLFCALLAELAGTARAPLVRRCGRGAPRAFTLGPWRGTRTVDVDVDLPAEALRADDAAPPVRILRSETRAFFPPAELARLEPLAGADAAPERSPSLDAPAEGIVVVNESPSRAIVTVRGVALGWVGEGQTAQFVGLRPGRHALGAVSPLGAVIARPRPIRLPARWVLR